MPREHLSSELLNEQMQSRGHLGNSWMPAVFLQVSDEANLCLTLVGIEDWSLLLWFNTLVTFHKHFDYMKKAYIKIAIEKDISATFS